MIHAVALIPLCLLLQPGDGSSQGGVDVRCGGYCLYVGLNALGFEIKDYEALESRLGTPGRLGYSIEELSEAAKSYGAHAAGVETSPARLRARPGRFACIALMDRGHFVNIYDVQDDTVLIADPPNKSQVSLDALKATWSGKALLISDQPLLPESQIDVGSNRLAWAAYLGSAVLLLSAIGLGVRGARRLSNM